MGGSSFTAGETSLTLDFSSASITRGEESLSLSDLAVGDVLTATIGSGTTVNISDSTITTSADNSGGIQTTGGGTTNAYSLTVTTSGNSSAAIRSDRAAGR